MKPAQTSNEKQHLTHRTVYNFGALVILPIDKEVPDSSGCSMSGMTAVAMYFEEPGMPMTWLHNVLAPRNHSFKDDKFLFMYTNHPNAYAGFTASDACGHDLENLTDDEIAAIPVCIKTFATQDPQYHILHIHKVKTLHRLRKEGISARRARFLLTLREVAGSHLPPDMLREITLAAYPRLLWRR